MRPKLNMVFSCLHLLNHLWPECTLYSVLYSVHVSTFEYKIYNIHPSLCALMYTNVT